MTLGALSLPVVVAALSLLVAWGSAALLVPLWTRAVRAWPGLGRTALLTAASPWLLGAAVAVAALFPGDPHIGQAFGCHCLDSMPAWMHLCPAHPAESLPLFVPALLVLGALLPGRLRGLSVVLRQPLGQGGGSTPRVVDLPAPMVLLVGWWRPTLAVDRGLWLALSEGERAAVLAHERGHLRRRDPQVLALLRALLAIGPASSGETMARAWLERAELLADADAARAVGDSGLVAATLLRCARLGGTSPTLSLSWTGGSLERRIGALLDVRPPVGPARPDVGVVDGLALLGLLAGGLGARPWLHHQLEHLLNLSL